MEKSVSEHTIRVSDDMSVVVSMPSDMTMEKWDSIVQKVQAVSGTYARTEVVVKKVKQPTVQAIQPAPKTTPAEEHDYFHSRKPYVPAKKPFSYYGRTIDSERPLIPRDANRSQRILAILKEHPGRVYSAKDICRHFGAKYEFERARIYSALKTLHDNGAIRANMLNKRFRGYFY